MDRAVESDNRLPCTGRSRYPSGTCVLAGDEVALLGMKKDGPLLRRSIESSLQFLHARDHAKASLSIGVGEAIRCRRRRHPPLRRTARRDFEHSLGGFGREVLSERKQPILVRLSNITQPLLRNAISKELIVGSSLQRSYCRFWRRLGLNVCRNDDLAD